MKIKFTKMHGLGNDFVVIDNRAGIYNLSNAEVIFLADRHHGVGCDQLLVLEKSSSCDLFMRVYNSDASEAGGCGNGARCIAKYIYEREGLKELRLETITTVWKTAYLGSGIYQVNLGEPKLEWNEIPLAMSSDTLNLDLGLPFNATCVNVGNPHAVFFVDEVEAVDLPKWGPFVETNIMFPQKTNVEFAQILSPNKIRMRVWERGEGITQACGTGASATLVAAIRNGLVKDEAEIILDGGSLQVKWLKTPDGGSELIMSGPATEVFEAEIEINNN